MPLKFTSTFLNIWNLCSFACFDPVSQSKAKHEVPNPGGDCLNLMLVLSESPFEAVTIIQSHAETGSHVVSL